MASRTFAQYRLSVEKAVAELWADITLAGSSNPTINRAKGIASVTRNAAGQLTFTLQDAYVKLLGVHLEGVVNATVTNIVGPLHIVTDNTNAAAKTLVVAFVTNSAGTFGIATDPTSGAVVKIRFVLSTTTAL